ncbi:MAG: murein biosynthesis integral membrane protein MurJ [Desulfovibrio sp.]|jgi:putative peptidoglycan lipid II flippase|nr:murein biosynthesis integral membrane protein MurJ [Desulfovibrio sp.]
MDAPRINSGEGRRAAAVAGGTLASRLLGLARDMLLAHLLGAGADVFLTAFRIPNLFRRLLAEGSLGMAQAAIFADTAARQGLAAAVGLSRDIRRAFLLLSAPLLLCLALASPGLIFLLAPGLAPAAAERAAFLFLCCLPYLPLCLLAGLALADRSCLGRETPQALAPAAFNLCLLLAGLVALALALSPEAAEILLCLGLSLAGLAQLALAGRSNPAGTSSFRAALARKEVRSALIRVPLTALGASVHLLQALAGTLLASFLAGGSISALYLAERLLEFPLGLAGVSLGLLAMPRLAEQAAGNNRDALGAILARHLSLSAFLALPAAAGLAALALPLAGLFFGHGACGPEEVRLTALCLAAYAPGLPAMCLARPLLAALAALGETRAAALAAGQGLAAAVAAALGGALLLGAPGIALGMALGAWAHAALLLRLLRKRGLGAFLAAAGRRCLAYILPALALGLPLHFLPLPPDNKMLLACLLAALVAGCALAWIFLFRAVRSPDALTLTGLLSSLLKT